ncbi:MAG: LysM peptidoglycan-binding domain-containing protein [Leptospirales bacterium]|nr:LysM peptidoglycan-binding domain-containing protein [Leptospirales bacterium]
MSSYYKRINGVNYDRSMLDAADKSVKGKGDGRISLDDAKALVKSMDDGGKITETELRTLDYIYRNYKMTEPASKYIEESLTGSSNSKDKANSERDKPKRPQKEPRHEDKPPALPKKSNSKIKYFLILLLILLILLIIFLLLNFSCNKGISNDEPIPVQIIEEKAEPENKTNTVDNKGPENNIISGENNKNEIKEKAATETKTDTADDKVLKNIISGENDKNKYVIKKNDTLTKISQTVYGNYRLWKDIYNANKEKIKNPNKIYSGQVLTIPEKR